MDCGGSHWWAAQQQLAVEEEIDVGSGEVVEANAVFAVEHKRRGSDTVVVVVGGGRMEAAGMTEEGHRAEETFGCSLHKKYAEATV